MPIENAALLAFNRGLLSTLGLARVDLKRAAWSSEKQTNWMPRALGSMMLRPGLGYTASTKNNAAAIHIPFIFASNDTALIELTDSVMRVIIDDVVVSRVAVSSAVSNGSFTTNLTGWSDADESGATSAWATGGYLSLIGSGFNAAIRRQEVVVSVADQGKVHALDIVIERGPVTLRVGSSAGDDDYITEAALGTGPHSLAFTPTTNFHIQLSSTRQAASLVDSILVASSGSMEIATPWGAADLANIRWAQSADVIYVACDGLQTRKIERRSTTSWGAPKYEPEDGPFRTQNVSATKLTPSALNGDITVTASQSYFRNTHVGGLFSIDSTGQQVTASLTGEDQFTDDIRVTGVGNSRIFQVLITGTWSATITLQRSIDEAGAWVDVTSYTTNQASVDFNDSLDNQVIHYRIGIKSGDFTSGTAVVTLTYSGGSRTGVFRVTGYTSAISISAAVLTQLGGTTASSDWAEGLWSDFRGYPTAVALYEGRLWLPGRTFNVGSVSDGFESFDQSIEGDSAPIVRNIGSGPVDVINWVLGLQRLLLGTLGVEWAIRSSSLDEPLSPTAYNPKKASTQGSAAVAAVELDSRGFYVQRGGTRLYMLEFDPTRGDFGDYASIDMTALVPEIGEPGISRMAVQRQPDTRIHCIRSDGTVGVLIFDRAEDVICWVDVEPPGASGLVEDVVVLPGTVEDTVYYLVQRTVNGATVRYREKWALESEAAIHTTIYDGASTTSITGLKYNDGTVVTVRDSDGAKIENLTVTAGAITLSVAATYAHITPALCKTADSFASFTNSPAAASVPAGTCSHLVGESVLVWADGKCLEDANGDRATFTVAADGGIAALTDGGSSFSAEQGVVGLDYTAQYKSTKLAYASGLGTALTQDKRVSRIGLILANTHHKGVRFGPSFDVLDPLPTKEDGAAVISGTVHEAYDEDSITFPGGWDSDSRVCLQAEAMRPATALAVVLPVKTNDSV